MLQRIIRFVLLCGCLALVVIGAGILPDKNPFVSTPQNAEPTKITYFPISLTVIAVGVLVLADIVDFLDKDLDTGLRVISSCLIFTVVPWYIMAIQAHENDLFLDPNGYDSSEMTGVYLLLCGSLASWIVLFLFPGRFSHFISDMFKTSIMSTVVLLVNVLGAALALTAESDKENEAFIYVKVASRVLIVSVVWYFGSVVMKDFYFTKFVRLISIFFAVGNFWMAFLASIDSIGGTYFPNDTILAGCGIGAIGQLALVIVSITSSDGDFVLPQAGGLPLVRAVISIIGLFATIIGAGIAGDNDNGRFMVEPIVFETHIPFVSGEFAGTWMRTFVCFGVLFLAIAHFLTKEKIALIVTAGVASLFWHFPTVTYMADFYRRSSQSDSQQSAGLGLIMTGTLVGALALAPFENVKKSFSNKLILNIVSLFFVASNIIGLLMWWSWIDSNYDKIQNGIDYEDTVFSTSSLISMLALANAVFLHTENNHSALIALAMATLVQCPLLQIVSEQSSFNAPFDDGSRIGGIILVWIAQVGFAVRLLFDFEGDPTNEEGKLTDSETV